MKEKMFLLEMERDDDGKWGYDGKIEMFISANKQEVFEKAVLELKQMRRTLRGKEYYVTRIAESLDKFIALLDSDLVAYEGTYEEDWGNVFNKSSWDIRYGFENGNASLNLSVGKIIVERTDTSISILKERN